MESGGYPDNPHFSVLGAEVDVEIVPSWALLGRRAVSEVRNGRIRVRLSADVAEDDRRALVALAVLGRGVGRVASENDAAPESRILHRFR